MVFSRSIKYLCIIIHNRFSQLSEVVMHSFSCYLHCPPSHNTDFNGRMKNPNKLLDLDLSHNDMAISTTPQWVSHNWFWALWSVDYWGLLACCSGYTFDFWESNEDQKVWRHKELIIQPPMQRHTLCGIKNEDLDTAGFSGPCFVWFLSVHQTLEINLRKRKEAILQTLYGRENADRGTGYYNSTSGSIVILKFAAIKTRGIIWFCPPPSITAKCLPSSLYSPEIQIF